MAQTKPKAGQFYGVSNNGTDGQFLKTDGTGGMSWDSPITNPTITSIDYPGTATAADPAGGESVIINGTLFASGITCTVGGTSAVTAFNSSTQITITTPAKAAGPYTVAVLNPNGGTASQANFIQYSGVPVWSTAAGTLGNVLEGAAASFQVTATEGSDTIEYAVTTGTLPTGLSLATATGAITGTAPAVSADTTTTFSITATDDENQTSASRSFSITVQKDVPSNHFNTVLYNGNGSTTQAITGVGFEAGFTWTKSRTGNEQHGLFDTVRGANEWIHSDSTAAQTTYSGNYGLLSWASDGFTVGNGSAINASGQSYVAWNFKAGGAAVANTDGTITSQVSVNNTLGFSIVKWTGTNAINTIGHGLSSAPELILIKSLDVAADWQVYAEPIGNNYKLALNTTSAKGSTSRFDSTSPTTSVFTFRDVGITGDQIAYCFTSKPGFSKIGSYTGNGSASGPMVQTGFEPAFLLVKGTDNTSSWLIYDNKRTPSNPRNNVLLTNTNSADIITSNVNVDFFANGFQIKTTNADLNSNSLNYIYLAIAADGSTATPSLANSFETQTWTGNNAVRTIPYDFKPDLWFAKNYTATNGYGHYWTWVDSIRGGNSVIYSNAANAANNNASGTGSDAFSFVNAGITFNISGANGYNENAFNFAGYAFKAGGGTPSINTDGTLTSIVSANQAAGFSVVKYTGTGGTNGQTESIGHGLSTAPELIIVKNTDNAYNWVVRVEGVTSNSQVLQLNLTDGVGTPSQTPWGTPTSSTFLVGRSSLNVNENNSEMVAYCFKSISGYSKVGTYSGTASANSITTGFEPGFVMIKRTDSTGSWVVMDSARGMGSNAYALFPNLTALQSSGWNTAFTATGFTISSAEAWINGSGGTYIYLAIKEN